LRKGIDVNVTLAYNGIIKTCNGMVKPTHYMGKSEAIP
jgi:hypothetical protein